MTRARALQVGIISSILIVTTGLALADTGPVISGATDITSEATAATGATVSFTLSATDATDGTDAVSCVPSSGSVFALGTTTVNCTSSNSLFATTTASFDVGVVDSTAPVITAPADQTFATTTIPSAETLTPATATDLVDPTPHITNDAPALFPFGTTTVTWTATDASGNSATATSNVGVFLNSDVTVDVPANCDVTDTDTVVHTYQASSSSSYLGICALQAAIASSSVSGVGLSNQFPSFGLFLTAIDGVSADSNSQYWALYQNGGFASTGLTLLPVVAGDTVSLHLHDFSDNELGAQVTIHINSLISTSTPPSNNGGTPGGGNAPSTPASFNISSALAYLSSKQNTDGSFGSSSVYTDWAAIAFGAADPGAAKTKLRTYLLTATPAMTSTTDYERHAMALEALGIDPYSGTPVNYIAPIVAAFDGTQIGTSDFHDDIFGIFALTHAGYSGSDAIIQKAAAYIVSKQSPNGSWGDPDSTGAAIQALGPLLTDPQIAGQVLGAAGGYLASTEQADGSWSNIFSTSWVQTAINGIIEAHTPGLSTESAWTTPSGKLPTDALAAAQQSDGAALPASETNDNRIWATSYAVSAASGKSWLTALQSFSKPAGTVGGGTATLPSTATSTSATSTVAVATSTVAVATSTPAVATTTPEITLPVATTAATSTAPVTKHPAPKKKTIVKTTKTPVATTITETPTAPNNPPIDQTASAASATSDGFIHKVLSGIKSFFSHLF